MEPICVTPVAAPDGLVTMEPITKWERELIVGYRRLSCDDQQRFLRVLDALVAVAPRNQSESRVG